MAESKKKPPRADTSCEIISFVVLAILSALSHFWYILIVFCATIFLRQSFTFISQYLISSIHFVPWHPWKSDVPALRNAELQRQVFKPSKIS